MIRDNSNLELYIHIPFCKKKCEYCDFLSGPANAREMAEYMKALRKELLMWAPAAGNHMVSSVFIGGGTPTILPTGEVEEMMRVIYGNYHVSEQAEITIEANPGTVSLEQLKAFAACGINRISIGLQSTEEELLKRLGRIHSYEDFLMAFQMARMAGFRNINVDLISGIPGQSLSEWEDTLKKITLLRPEHISAYGLIIEPGTRFHEKYAADEKRREAGYEPMFLPSEELERQMYQLTGKVLGEKGYRRYEISNYAKAGKECRHNRGYWKREEYLGFGIGAASLFRETRWSNTRNRNNYVNHIARGEFPLEEESLEKLSQRAQMEEYMFLGLRMMEGIQRSEFEKSFGHSLEGVFGDSLIRLQKEGLLEMEEGRIRLSEKGIDLSNYVFSQFLLEGDQTECTYKQRM
jgi:oxygen-independent coproporphyrinogen III oxidase